MGLIDIKSMLPDELEERFISIGEKKYRAGQVFSWLHKGVKSFDEMTDLPIELRGRLRGHFYITAPEISEKLISKKDGTIKYLWKLNHAGGRADAGSECIESVLMDYKHGTTICISTQLGCRMGCAFCASAIGGFVRDLTAGEMLDQVIFSGIDSGKKISNCVLMGIGEPLDNFDNVMRFIRLVSHAKGLNIGARHLTVSTCGVIENIDRLADSGVQLSLAISLHAPDNETRNRLVLHNRHTGVEELIGAAKRYFGKTGRRVMFEYVMIDGINDSPEHAGMLAQRLKGTGSLLNLIPLSPVSERGFHASTRAGMDAFTNVLVQNKISFTTRRGLGADIEASCGQLRRKNLTANGSMGNNSQRQG